MISVTVVTGIDEAHEIAGSWDRLPAAGASSIYTSPAWCLAAWRHFPDLGAPLLVVARNKDKAIVGVLPLTLEDGRVTWPASPLGDEHDARVMLRPDQREITLALVTAVRECCATGIEPVLTDVRPEGLLATLLRARTGCPAPVLPLSVPDLQFGSLACIPGWSKKRRRRLRNTKARLHRLGSVSIERVDSADELALMLPSFVADRLTAWQSRNRLDELPGMDRHRSLPAFLSAVGHGLGTHRRCALMRLCVDGEPIAQSLFFLTPSAYLWYMSTYRPDMARYSPSHLLLAEVAAQAIAEGIHVIELGRGDEPYKFDHGAIERDLNDVFLEPVSECLPNSAGTVQT